jgi:hypothetical protein
MEYPVRDSLTPDSDMVTVTGTGIKNLDDHGVVVALTGQSHRRSTSTPGRNDHVDYLVVL